MPHHLPGRGASGARLGLSLSVAGVQASCRDALSWGRSTVMWVKGVMLVDSVVDMDTVDRVMGLAGASQFRNTIEPVAFASASAASFAVAGENIRLCILTPPEVAREASGQA